MPAVAGFLMLTAVQASHSDPVFLDDFDDADVSDWTPGCERQDHSGDQCFVPNAVGGGVELSSRSSCFSAPFNGVASTLTQLVPLTNGKYVVQYDVQHHTNHYAFCSGGTGGNSAIVVDGTEVNGTSVGCAVGGCGECDRGPQEGSGCFTVADGGPVKLTLRSSGGDCAAVKGFFDNVEISEALTVEVETQEKCLWPPNHKTVCFENVSDGVRVVDQCGDEAGLVSVICESNQCDDASCDENPGENGDGHTTEDCVYDADTDTLCVRAERAGTDEDRVYKVTFVASDGDGNTAEAVGMLVTVPHDQASHADCIKP